MNRTNYNRTLHWMALLTAAVTFPLIFMGGLVTSKGAGMSVPDWPNTWGYNMFTFPIQKWVGGIFYEHLHRLIAAFVGFLTVVLMGVAFATDRRRYIRWTAVAIFLAVSVQGVIGGLRVVLSERDLAMVHGCAAQLCFCFMATYCVMTSPFWTDRQTISAEQRDALRPLLGIAVFATAIVLMQLIIGAIMRHSDAGLAIPDLPLAYGHWLPPTSLDDGFRASAIHEYGPNLGLSHVTLFQIWIHFAHRIGAIFVTAAIVTLSIAILRRRKQNRLTSYAVALLILLAAQITLGVLTVLLRKPADIASAHVAVGSLVLMTSWITVVRIYRLLHPATAEITSSERLGGFEPVTLHAVGAQ